MNRIDVQFLLLAALLLLVGVTMGIFMASTQDFTLRPVHAHINLVGWASLALFGLVYRAYPGLAKGWLATLHILLAAAGALLLPPGIALAVLAGSEVLAITASFLWLAASAVFFVQLLRLASADGSAAPGVDQA
jgi:hypothetical protein